MISLCDESEQHIQRRIQAANPATVLSDESRDEATKLHGNLRPTGREISRYKFEREARLRH